MVHLVCGIAGALDLVGGARVFPEERLASMARALRHRGPDGEGRFVAPGVALAATRLAIVDPGAPPQPFANESGEIVAVCNGELFDHRRLREELVSRGHRLATRCDAELWPHLWEEQGHDTLGRARGQFALALWDARRRELVLARDRFGVCPLHYAVADGWLLWASEIKALFASGLVAPRGDARGIDHVFSFFCAPARRTAFEGVTSLAPGEALVARDGRWATRRHSDLDFPAMGQELPTEPGALFDALRLAVAKRLDVDVPVAAYLSGGVDSTTIVGLAASLGRAPHTFTIGFDGAGTDETPLARASAARFGAELTVVRMSKADVAAALPDIHAAAEAPLVDTSTACLMRLAEAARGEGFRVALTGEGADEALAGYVWLRVEKALGLAGAWPSRALRDTVFGLVGGERAGPRGALAGLRTAQRDIFDPFARVRHELYSEATRDLLRDHDPYDDLDVDVERMRRWHPLNRSLYVDYRVMLPGLLLHAKGDRASMRSGLETRYPFLDDEVVDLCARARPADKLHGLTEKWLLRRAAAGLLPRRDARRSKRMFRAKLSSVTFGKASPTWVKQLVSRESLARAGWFAPEVVVREIERQARFGAITPRRMVMDGALVAVVSTQLWHHLFLGGGLCDLAVPSWG